ncbi:MAG: AI-2E family transporter [Clostridia bacterium]|nr:AI-2E family transporter [Clostridia bacterium]
MERRKIWLISLTIGLTGGILIFMYHIRVILTPFFLSIIFAYILLPGVETLVKRQIPISLAILIIYLTVASVVAVLILYVFPGIFAELNRFAETVPLYTGQIQVWLSQLHEVYNRFNIPEGIRQVIDETILLVEKTLIQAARNIAQGIIGLVGHVLSIVIVPVLTFYFLKDHELICKRIVSLLPPAYRTEFLTLWARINSVLRKFIRGHLSVACIVGTLTGLGLALVGVDYAVTLGLMAGAADIIPYFGPIIGALPAVFLALLQSKKLALKVVLIMFIVQQLENSIISPRIIGDSVGIHPLAIIFVLLIGGYFWGVLGMLFAVPLAVVLRVLITYVYQKAITYRAN